MKAILRVFPFALYAASLLSLSSPASAQSSGGASACSHLAAKLVPERLAATPSNPRFAMMRRVAHIREYVGCLRSHNVQPASRQIDTARGETFVSFEVPGSNFTSPTAINAAGTIAGTYFDANFVNHSFVRSPSGALVPFDPSGATGGSLAVAINAEGTIIGQACDAITCHGYLRYPAGNILTFDPPGSLFTYPIALNPAGTATGFYCDAARCHGFLRSRIGEFVSFDPPGEIFTGEFAGLGVGNVMGINASGTIAGSFSQPPSNVLHGFVRTRLGAFSTFDPQGSVFTVASDINEHGTIAGYFQDANGVFHGYARAPSGAITVFDPPNSLIQTIACCINAAGTILGWYIDPNFVGRVFLRARDGAITVLDPPGSLAAQAAAINARRSAAGFYCDAAAICRGFLRNPRRSEMAGG